MFDLDLITCRVLSGHCVLGKADRTSVAGGSVYQIGFCDNESFAKLVRAAHLGINPGAPGGSRSLIVCRGIFAFFEFVLVRRVAFVFCL